MAEVIQLLLAITANFAPMLLILSLPTLQLDFVGISATKKVKPY